MSRIRSLTVASMLLALAACKKEAPPPTPAPPPAPVAVPETPPPAPLAELAPMEPEDAAAPPAPTTPAKPVSTATALATQVKRCCSALAVEAKRSAGTVEGGLMAGAATQCSSVATQVEKNPNSPEVTVLRNMLNGRPVPAVCKF